MKTFHNINKYRVQSLIQLSKVESLRKNIAHWKQYLQKSLQNRDPKTVFDIGDNLSEMFQSSKPKESRSQSAVSGAGTAWEGLVCWYLNLILWNTNLIAIRPTKDITPKVINNSKSVILDNRIADTESDLIIYDIPHHSHIGFFNIDQLNDHLKKYLNEMSMVLIQCKTNWNDNSQIPMLWDIIYTSAKNGDLKYPKLSVGTEGVNISNLKSFNYAFMTVPSGKIEKFKPTSMNVSRVRSLSGGNYWGYPTLNGVALSIKEIFNQQFSEKFPNGIESHIKKNLIDPNYLNWFINWSWDEKDIN